MNKTYCNGKFFFKDTLTKKDIANDKKIDREYEADKKKNLTRSDIAIGGRNTALNRKIRKALFAYLDILGYKVNHKRTEIGDGYFLFDMGKETVVHFSFKNFWLKKYRFGIWISPKAYFEKSVSKMNDEERKEYYKLTGEQRDDKYTVVQLFHQHEDYIDKFKPSRSAPVINLYRSDLDKMFEFVKSYEKAKTKKEKLALIEQDKFTMTDLKDLFSFMIKHPFYEYAGLSSSCNMWFFNTDMFHHPIKYFIKSRYQFYSSELKNNIKKTYGKWKAIHVCKAMAKEKCVKKVEMIGFNTIMPGCSTDYDFEIRIAFTKDSTLKECSRAFDKHFKTDRFGEYDYYHCYAKLTPDHIHLTKECDYTDETDGQHYTTAYLSCWHPSDVEKKRYTNCVEYYKLQQKLASNEELTKNKTNTKSIELIKDYPTLEKYLEMKQNAENDYNYLTRQYVRYLVIDKRDGSDYPILDELDYH